jgi:nicotinate-nucleotide--dimethylbenzimidazole phosphoribosyltransferase
VLCIDNFTYQYRATKKIYCKHKAQKLYFCAIGNEIYEDQMISDSFGTLAEFKEIIKEKLPLPDEKARCFAEDRNESLTKPSGSLARLEEIAIWLCEWQGKKPSVDAPVALVFAGDHGIAVQGVSSFPIEVTKQMIANFHFGGAAINQICNTFGTELFVYEVDPTKITEDFSIAPAMSEEELLYCLQFGWQKVMETDGNIYIFGEMGIANTTSASAIYSALYRDSDVSSWTGRGSGIGDASLRKKTALIEKSLKNHASALNDPMKILQYLGGYEIAAIAGAMCAARVKSVPVILDGFVSCSAAAVIHAINTKALDNCIAGHCSNESGHVRVLQKLGKTPILLLGMRLGEGSGAALALGIIKAAAACYNGMATFEEAIVSNKIDDIEPLTRGVG